MDTHMAVDPMPLHDGLNCHRMDPGIEHEVRVLWEHGVETFESCEGGMGHAFPSPTIRFRGNEAEGLRAFGIAVRNGLKVRELRRAHFVTGSEPRRYWEMTFDP